MSENIQLSVFEFVLLNLISFVYNQLETRDVI